MGIYSIHIALLQLQQPQHDRPVARGTPPAGCGARDLLGFGRIDDPESAAGRQHAPTGPVTRPGTTAKPARRSVCCQGKEET